MRLRMPFRFTNLVSALLLLVGLVPLLPSKVLGAPANVVISQVYGGGGNSGATLKNDFMELFNRGSSPVDLTGWTIQYGSATGATWNASTTLSGTIQPGQYLLIQQAAGTGGTAPLPTPDFAGNVNMSGTGGKVALVNSTTPLSGACPSGSTIVDLIGWGAANCSEGAAAAATSNATAVLRNDSGCQDSDSNSADWAVGQPAPRNSASSTHSCGSTPDPGPGPNPDPGPVTHIAAIQGASHLSPMIGQTVTNVQGIVTAVRTTGFFMQDPQPDQDNRTSDAIYVHLGQAPTVTVGDLVRVSATVTEFRPSNASDALTLTELTGPTVTVLSSGNPLPAPVILGAGGRPLPTSIIEDDANGNVETNGVFDLTDGVDFWESLEGMLVQVNDPLVVSPTNQFGEFWVLADQGADATGLGTRGNITISANDFNPERILLDDVLAPTPIVDAGDRISGSIQGVVDYAFKNFRVYPLATPQVIASNLPRGTTQGAAAGEVAVATFNVKNLSPVDGQDKFDRLAGLIVSNMAAPDLVILEEIQDNTGPTDDGVTAADQTLSRLISAIQTAGGPTYTFRQISPQNDQDGGQPGGNIRQGFLYRTDRGLAFVDRPGGDATTPVQVVSGPTGPALSVSPGRIDPLNSAWQSSRKPLVGEFTYHGQSLFVVANHLNSKGGDGPLFGRYQPAVRSSEVQRHQQATAVAGFVSQLVTADATAKIIVAGDLNDFQFSETVATLKAAGLQNPMEDLPPTEQYSYNFEGNAQALDHILLSTSLYQQALHGYNILHVNAGYADQASDHDPQLVRLHIGGAPTVSVADATVNEGGTVTLTASATDPDGDPLTFAWDLDNNGSFETPGETALFSAAGMDGPGTRTVAVQVTDPDGLKGTATATITIVNVAPVVSALQVTPGTVAVGATVTATATATDPVDPVTLTWGWGDGATGTGDSATHVYAAPGTYTVTVTASDKDGGSASATQTVTVTPPVLRLTGDGSIPGFLKQKDQFVVNATKTGTAVSGSFKYKWVEKMGWLEATNLTSLRIEGNTATLTGTGSVKGLLPYRFEVVFIKGAPGAPDRMAIRIEEATTGLLVYANYGPVTGSVQFQ